MNQTSKSNSGETLSIYIGTPAVNLAVNTWELLTLEHGIKPDGTVQSISEDSFSKLKDPSSFFTQTKSGKNVPKALLFDLDPFSLNEVRQGVYRTLFDSENLINGKSPATLYSIAYDSGKIYLDKILDKILLNISLRILDHLRMIDYQHFTNQCFDNMADLMIGE